MTALALDNVTARFGDTPVLGPLSLALKTGERVALVGKSGAGKSTLLSLLYDEARETGVYMPQDLGLVETLSVFHNVFMGRLDQHSIWYNLANLIHPMKRPTQDIHSILETLSLADKIREPAGELSGGNARERPWAGPCISRAGFCWRTSRCPPSTSPRPIA